MDIKASVVVIVYTAKTLYPSPSLAVKENQRIVRQFVKQIVLKVMA